MHSQRTFTYQIAVFREKKNLPQKRNAIAGLNTKTTQPPNNTNEYMIRRNF